MPIERWRAYQALSLVAASILAALALPDWLASWQPRWVTMVLLFWVVTRPGEAGFGMAWAFGLANDLMTGTWVGVHVISYCVIVFLCARLSRALQLSDAVQRFSLVALLLALHMGYLHLFSLLLSNVNLGLAYWLSLPSSLLVWPLLYYPLYKLQGRQETAA